MALSDKYFLYDKRGIQIMFIHREAHHLRSILALLAGMASFVIALVAIGGLLFMIDQSLSGPNSSNLLTLLLGSTAIIVAVIIGL
ncbi:MAG: hypothetical protein O7G85_16260 [Planctomycetota bacterium]|nr:hypothetical protein [Planctomycetota bacterium]